MNRKWKQIYTILLQIAMIAMLVACGKNTTDEQEDSNNQNVSEYQIIPSSDEEVDEKIVTDLVEDQTNAVPLYKTISQYSSDGVLQKVIECTYDDSALTLTCVVAESGESYVFSYDTFSRIIDEKVFDCNGVLTNWRAYDKDGNIEADIEYNDDGTIYEGYEFQYDGTGNKVKYVGYNSNGGYYEEEYDSDGNEISTISHKGDGSIAYSISYDYEYNSDGNITVKLKIYGDGRISREEYEYDANRNNIKKTSYDADGVMTGWDEYEYDADGNKTRSSDYFKYGGDEYPRHSHTCTWEYNSDGNMIREVWYRSDGTINYEEEYDTNGQLIKDWYYDDDGSFTSGFENKYDSDGKIIKYLNYKDGVIASEQVYEYEYGSNGQVILRKLKDAVDGKELEKVEYVYDSEGNLLRSSTYDGKGNAVVVDFQTALFKLDKEALQQKESGQYRKLAVYDVPVDTSEYYDYLLCSGGGYSLVAKQVESVTDVTDYVGVLNEDFEWVVPLSDNTPLNPNGNMVDENGYTYFNSICSQLKDEIYYSGDGIFIFAKRTIGGYYRGSMLRIQDGMWFDPGYYDSNSLIFNDGILVTADCDRFGHQHEYVKIISSSGDIKTTDIYCCHTSFIGQYSEGLFFSYDGFYNLDCNRVIDLSEYAGLIVNHPYFTKGQCTLIAENSNGTQYIGIIDSSGNFISEFTQIE